MSILIGGRKMSTATAIRKMVAHPPRELVDFAKRQAFNAKVHQGSERRANERYTMVLPVVVQPVDEQFNSVGDIFDVVTRDLSPKGVGLIHLDPIFHEFLALHMILANTEVNVVARVVWRSPLGPFCGTGAEFISRLKCFPHSESGICESIRGCSQLSTLSLVTERCLQTTKGLTDDCRRGRTH